MSALVKTEEVTALAVDVIAFGRDLGFKFRPMDYRGVPQEPFTDGEFVYRLARQMPNDFEMPMKAWRRFFAVYESPIPIKDVVIAEEIEPYREWQRTLEAGKKTAKAAGIVAATVGVGILTMLAAAPLFLAADPKLIIICDSPEQEWISIAEWL